MKMPQYCFTERGAALFRQVDLQSHMNTQRNTTLDLTLRACSPQSSRKTRAHVDIVGAAKESSAYACMLDPPRHLGNPMSVVRPLATQEVPGETDSSFAASVPIIGEGECCYAPVLADLFKYP